MKNIIAVLFALIALVLVPATGRAQNLVDPVNLVSTDPSSWAWLLYTNNPGNVPISLAAFAYGWLPTNGTITAERRGSAGLLFQSGFEEVNSTIVPILDPTIDATWWDLIPGEGPMDFQTVHDVAVLTEQGQYHFEVFFRDDGDETYAEFLFDVPSFSFSIAEACLATPSDEFVNVRFTLVGFEALPNTVEHLEIEVNGGTESWHDLPIVLTSDERLGFATILIAKTQYNTFFSNQDLVTTIVLNGEPVRRTQWYRPTSSPCQ